MNVSLVTLDSSVIFILKSIANIFTPTYRMTLQTSTLQNPIEFLFHFYVRQTVL